MWAVLVDQDKVPDIDEASIATINHDDLYKLIDSHSASIQLRSDEDGFFLQVLPAGEYLLCVAYSPPWGPGYNSFGCTAYTISSRKATRMWVQYSPMGGFIGFQIQ
jgi:hypothetical protein